MQPGNCDNPDSMIPDGELLRRYADEKSEEAFTLLVKRHVHLVYHASLRRVGYDAHAAEDVTQEVFTDLARKAGTLRGRETLAGWLHTATHFLSADTVRAERRRRAREHEAHTMSEINADLPLAPNRLDPVLDEVLQVLAPGDREALLLHFFEGHSFVAVGKILSLSSDAARMRVNRSLDRLRTELAGRGIASTATALGTALTAQAALTAPAALVESIAGHALGAAGLAAVSVPAAGWLATLKGSPGLVLTTVVAVVLVWVGLSSTRQVPAMPPGRSVAQPVVPRPSEADATDRAVVEAELILLDAPEPVPSTGSGLPPPVAVQFAELPPVEQSVIRQYQALWEFRGTPAFGYNVLYSHSVRGQEFALGAGSLEMRGLLRLTANGFFSLTPAGRELIETNKAEIAALPLQFGRPEQIMLPTEIPAFASLTKPEKDVLKRLMILETNRPPSPGRAAYFTVVPTALSYPRFIDGRSRLLARGWVQELGVPGGVTLAASGRKFIEKNREAIEAYDPAATDDATPTPSLP